MGRLCVEMTLVLVWLEKTEWRLRDQLEATLLNQGRDDAVQTMTVRFEQFTEIFRVERSSLEFSRICRLGVRLSPNPDAVT